MIEVISDLVVALARPKIYSGVDFYSFDSAWVLTIWGTWMSLRRKSAAAIFVNWG
jgi:hypothetical protein